MNHVNPSDRILNIERILTSIDTSGVWGPVATTSANRPTISPRIDPTVTTNFTYTLNGVNNTPYPINRIFISYYTAAAPSLTTAILTAINNLKSKDWDIEINKVIY